MVHKKAISTQSILASVTRAKSKTRVVAGGEDVASHRVVSLSRCVVSRPHNFASNPLRFFRSSWQPTCQLDTMLPGLHCDHPQKDVRRSRRPEHLLKKLLRTPKRNDGSVPPGSKEELAMLRLLRQLAIAAAKLVFPASPEVLLTRAGLKMRAS